ncbi:MAG: efflux RND transporter permease subunit [Candidatus Omnitrophica bacterium]|nr:efflux RND transporter permease subunit [Candidatus Omnitrophota bacterium]
MSLSDISIKNPVFAWMLMAALMIFGIISYSRLGVSQLPDIDFPVVSVSLTWEGAAPEVMESDVVDIVEDSIMSIQGVRDVSSSIRQGSANITIEFDLGRDIDVAVQDVQNKIQQVQKRLPNDIDPATISKVNPEDQPIVMITFSSATMPLRDLMTYVQDHLKDQFATISGVGEIYLGGYVDRNLRIWVDSSKLEAYQLTVQDVIDAVEKQHEEIPAGRLETSKDERNIRVMGEAGTPEEFGNIIIPKRNGLPVFRPIYIKNVATIEDGLADIRRIARTNGKQTVALGIRKQRGANEVEAAHGVLKRLEEVNKSLPKEIEANVRYNRTKFSEDSIHELVFTLLLSALVTSLVCWAFLGSWSATLNILLAIPTSILGTFIIIYFMGFTLNTFTVLGLSLAIGIVVDDAIMVLENIVRRKEEGEEQIIAAREGARQISFAAGAATAALIAIFLPVAFMIGIIGKFFYQYGVTISVAVALSLLEALTLTPMRCSQFLQVGERSTVFGRFIEKSFRWSAEKYKKLLTHALHFRVWVLIITTLLFFGSLYLVKILRKEFLPSQDQSMFICRMQTPVGSSIDFTAEHFKLAEDFISKRPEVQGYTSLIGGFSGGEVNSGIIFVTFKDPKERPVVPPNKRPLSQNQLMIIFRQELNKIPDVRATIQDLSLSGFSAQRGFPIEISLRGPDWDKLAIYSEKMRKLMSESPLMVDVDTDYLERVPEIEIIPFRERASSRGVSITTIGNAIDALIGGKRIGKYTKDGRRYDVRIRVVPNQRNDLEDIENIWVWNNLGELVQLKEVVTIIQKPKPITITRRNRERAISLFSNVAQGKSQTDALKEVERIAKEVLPEGYRIVLTGSTQTFKESFSSLIFALLLGILIAYMVLASQFNSYIHPIVVLLALPFSISGALVTLWIGNQSLNIFSLIGLILLMGIVKKNSILLVDFTNQMRNDNLDLHSALLKACPIRLRPILMTSIATIAAAIPPALALGPGAETRIPMAITIIGGVTLSTVLTLFVVPCAYSLFSKIERKKFGISRKDSKRVGELK